MSKQQEFWGDSESPVPGFDRVMVRARHDGWTVDKQTGFIEALAETGCVAEASAHVGMTARSAYRLRSRVDAQSFRFAWDAALDHAVRRLSDAVLGRAINGVSRPVFYQGEQIGERRHYDERLAMFILRYRDPNRYGRWNDRMITEPVEPDHAALALGHCLLRLLKDGHAFDGGDPAPEHEPYDPVRRAGLAEMDRARAARARGEAQHGGGRADGNGKSR